MNRRVQIQSGTVEGIVRAQHVVFRGIPYAKPPVGALRFRPPEPPEPLREVREAHRFGAMAMQGASFAPGTDVQGTESEDCLYLNVFTREASARKRPVLVWIHGGAYTVGSASSPLYNGGPLCELGDVVVVTFNYRLGSFGFLFLGEAGARIDATPNLALLDQIAALTWVRENIAGFGGDPANVTLFGESAGATSVCALMVAPKAEGLFHKAIAQSNALTLTLPSHELAEQTSSRLLKKLDLTISQSERLRELPAEAIIKAQRAMESEGMLGSAFFPVLDAESLPFQPGQMLAKPGRQQVPLLIGSNRDEWNLFDARNVARWGTPMADTELVGSTARRLHCSAEQAESLVGVYRDSRQAHALPHDARALLRAITGDYRFRIPSLRVAEAHAAAGGATFMYLFTYESPALRGALGACHALDLPFVFGTLSANGQDRFAGTGPAVEALSATMMRTWLSFAQEGAPTHLPDFAPYRPPGRLTMELNLMTRLVEDPLGAEREAWGSLA